MTVEPNNGFLCFHEGQERLSRAPASVNPPGASAGSRACTAAEGPFMRRGARRAPPTRRVQIPTRSVQIPTRRVQIPNRMRSSTPVSHSSCRAVLVQLPVEVQALQDQLDRARDLRWVAVSTEFLDGGRETGDFRRLPHVLQR